MARPYYDAQIPPILYFTGAHGFLSNFYTLSSMYPVCLDGDYYRTVEHAYQAAKTLDANWRRTIAGAPTAGYAKRNGRRAPLRDGWDAMKIDVMRMLLVQKFQDAYLQERLLRTGDAQLIEGNTWGDVFWGCCGGRGENHLGRLLMEIRFDLIEARELDRAEM